MIDFHQLQYYVVDNNKAIFYKEKEIIDELFMCLMRDYENPEVFNNSNFKHDVSLIKHWINGYSITKN